VALVRVSFPVSAGENGGVNCVHIESSSGRSTDRSSLSALKLQCKHSGEQAATTEIVSWYHVCGFPLVSYLRLALINSI
jgi:hypothetical protein